jgi:benzoyl-CoA reductase/2-hydroxyglutaryl-CoA dehydratase subunit BcrC/BadD/HgdB
MSTALETLRYHYHHRESAARDWKAAGGRVVGYLCDNVPEELILAAGFFPYRLSGDPCAGTEAIEHYIQVFAAPFSARNRGVGFSDAMLNMLLSGRFDFLDFLIVPHTRKTIQAFYRELSLARDHFPELRLPELYYLDRAYTPFFTSDVFNRQCVLDLKTQLETWSGQPITDAALGEAVAATNTGRGLLQELARARAADPPHLSGVDALQVVGASYFILRRDHNLLLERVVADECAVGVPTGGPRLFVGGSPIDHLQLYELVEECGATIVAEDHCWGHRCGEFPLDASLPALEALSDRYHRKPACSIDFPMARVVDRCVGRATTAQVDGALFFVLEGDGVHVWDTPSEIEALGRTGVPCLYLKHQPYWIDEPDALCATVREFVGTLSTLGSAEGPA